MERAMPLTRVGHKGADLVAPGNTFASFEAALGHGVDMIEFDVLRLRDGRLVLAHDFEDAAKRDGTTLASLDEGLDHFAGEAYAGVDLDVDMKLPGYECEVIEGLRARALDERALISSQYIESLDRIGGELGGGIRRGLSVPKVRRDYTRTPLAPVVYAIARWMRARLPGRAAALMEAGRIEAVMAHWILVGPRLAPAIHTAGGQLYVWTVDDLPRIERLAACGVDGVITNDPRLFDDL